MKDAKKTVRRYIGLSKRWKLILTGVAVLGAVLSCLFRILDKRPDPEPVPFDPVTSEKGDYCYFDAVGISGWICRENDSATTYYIAKNAKGNLIVVTMDSDHYRGLFSQQLYFSAPSLFDEPPKAFRLLGSAVPIGPMDSTRKNIAEALQIDVWQAYNTFGSTILAVGDSPKKQSAARVLSAAIFTWMGETVILLYKLAQIILMALSFKHLKKNNRFEDAARLIHESGGEEPAVVKEGFVIYRNKGIAVCPEAVKEAVCAENTVKLKSEIETVLMPLRFYDVAEARRFMEYIPLACVRDDEIMVKTKDPEKYEEDYYSGRI